MRVLAACSLGGAGHLNPLLPFLAACEDHDESVLAGPPALAGMAADSGLRFWPGGEPPEAAIGPIREQLARATAAVASELANRELFGRLATTAMLPEMQRLFEQWRPQLVLRDPCEYASAVLARRTGTTAAQVAISFADVEAGAIRVASGALEQHGAGLTDALLDSPYLSRFPQSLDPSPFRETLRYREPMPATSELPDWWHGSEEPLVYVTLGTVLGAMSHATAAFRTMLEAVRGLRARVLLTTGRHLDVAGLGTVPQHVHVEPWVDQLDVLGSASLVVSHGGSGTVLGALAAAVPQVLVPSFADQFENARRVARAGAGRAVSRERTGTQEKVPFVGAAPIAAAIEDVLNDARYASERACDRRRDACRADGRRALRLAPALGGRRLTLTPRPQVLARGLSGRSAWGRTGPRAPRRARGRRPSRS